MDTKDLEGMIAVVAGASRGIGRGVAEELGAAGATVVVTGRTARGAGVDGLPGGVEETAALVEAAGGRGEAVVCDHTDEAAVAALAQIVRARHGRVDILVHAVWGGYEAYDAALFAEPPWAQPVWRWDKMFGTGVRAAWLTCRALLPLVLASRRKLVALVSAGDRGRFLGDVQYDVSKAAMDRLGFALARRLRRDGLVAVTLHPGLTATERVVAHSGGATPAGAHSARFVGRAVVALARDTNVAARSGGVFRVGELGEAYGLRDVDGGRVEPFEIPEDL